MAIAPDSSEKNSDQPVAPLAKHFLWADTASGVRKLILGLVVLSTLLFAIDFVWHRHVKVPGEEVYGFHAIAGFVSFTVIVLGARLLRVFIQRDESFYAPYGVDSEEYPLQDTDQRSHDQRVADDLTTFKAELIGQKKPEREMASVETTRENAS